MSLPWKLSLLAGALCLAVLRMPEGPSPAYAIDCDTYPNQQFAQLFLKINPDDPHGLDGPNDNGIACEELPCPCDLEPVEEAIGDQDGDTDPSAGADQSGTTASAGSAGASASVATETPVPTPAAAIVPADPTATQAEISVRPNMIVPPTTGSAGLR